MMAEATMTGRAGMAKVVALAMSAQRPPVGKVNRVTVLNRLVGRVGRVNRVTVLNRLVGKVNGVNRVTVLNRLVTMSSPVTTGNLVGMGSALNPSTRWWSS